MIKGDVIFCATGVTDGEMLKGIIDKGDFSKLHLLFYIKVKNYLKKLLIY